MTEILLYAFMYLVAAVIAVPLANRFGLGSVLGYLIAGVVIGPLLGLVGSETETLQHFAEFGVVMMLFLVGLELEPRMLWEMRAKLLGLGGLQVGITAGLIFAAGMAFGLYWSVALTIGLIFALSSTAIVLQTLNEKGLTKTEGGRASFSVLLFQDIAVIPMLAVIPLLALPEFSQAAAHGADHHEELSLVAGLPGWGQALAVAGAIATVVLGGHYLTRPLFRIIAEAQLREIFTAAALMLVIGIAVLMSLVGLSPALGTFLAGVVLATSEFRHELESDIEPFKGLLLGLFFITVGAGINFEVLFGDFALVMGLTFGVMLLKALVLLALSFLFKIRLGDRWLFSLSLAQAGEFGFVLLSFSSQNAVLPPDLVPILSLVVALSMLLTPLLFILFEKVILPKYSESDDAREADEIGETGKVIIAGMGRFGQVVSRMLVANDIHPVVLDLSPTQVEAMRIVNIRAYYGDATRLDLLRSAGINEASLLVVAIDNPEQAIELTHQVKRYFPNVHILARAYDRGHYYRLRSAGADLITREYFEGALKLAKEALVHLGQHPFEAEQRSRRFRQFEKSTLDDLYGHWVQDHDFFSNAAYRASFIAMVQEASVKVVRDIHEGHDSSGRAWSPPPKGYVEDIASDADIPRTEEH
ncbi:monovalent cation:proton antiporter-2 (CPA2) family protein [Ferrimonas balearica]|uniref:monovalent cation:proton antiporter-2 (CPA2) family protein n=1 Tax=Ferrimonas balearica TaxID=44012 RepID=UPI001C99FF6E|nr:monovalent cation:proton antiporter-2 (CPA2) family protein [Ferrimonas balearica]MBY5991382.1 monovalent cation:proton antiporter-2 (CPA2) family protein [Ferrimonas balearica]